MTTRGWWSSSECVLCLDSVTVSEYRQRLKREMSSAYRHLPPEEFAKVRFEMRLCRAHQEEYDLLEDAD